MQADPTLLADLVKSDTITLINADGRKLTLLGTTTASLDLGIITVDHTLVVVEHLSTPVILGCDFLITHDVIHSQFSFVRQSLLKVTTLQYVDIR